MKNVYKGIMLTAAIAVVVAWFEPAFAADRLAEAIAEAKGTGALDSAAEPGYLGIPGAPHLKWWWGLIWAVWVGWIFSTVGAFGGIMAGVGHITMYGLGDYAKSFNKKLMLNKVVTDSIRVSNQWLVGCSAALSSFNYYRMGRLVMPLAVALAVGSVAGSWLVPILTAGKISLKAYLGYFGLFVLFLGCYLFYETTPTGQAKKKESQGSCKTVSGQCEEAVLG